MPTHPSPDDRRPDAAAAAQAARNHLTVIRGRAHLLLRRLRRSQEVPPGTMEAGLVEIEAAARALLAAIEELERGLPPADDGPR